MTAFEATSNMGESTSQDQHAGPPSSGHDRHCFVVMPSGREPSEQKWFRGWYEVVLKPAVREAGYEPVLAAAAEQPGAINGEIRTHLAVDPMVVVDLGGAEPEDDPNPNVMYELGIRHALGLPLVMLAWKGQRLPFDVGNQRVIMEDRDLVDPSLVVTSPPYMIYLYANDEGRVTSVSAEIRVGDYKSLLPVLTHPTEESSSLAYPDNPFHSDLAAPRLPHRSLGVLSRGQERVQTVSVHPSVRELLLHD